MRRWNWVWRVGGAVAAALILTTGGYAEKGSETGGERGGRPPMGSSEGGRMGGGMGAMGGGAPPTVVVAKAARELVLVEAELPGRLVASRRAEVRARVEGIVERVRYREGSEVRAGETLFELDDRPYRAALAAAEAAVALRRAELARQQRLVAEGFAAPQSLDTARANLAAAEAQRTQAALNVEYARVPAPISGRAGRALVTEGALVGKGEATLLTVIEVLDPIHALIQEPQEKWMIRQRLQGETPPPRLMTEGEEVSGEWIVSDTMVDPATGTVTSKVAFPNRGQRWLPGMFVKVRVAIERREAVVVPQQAVASGASGLFVWVVEDGYARMQPVTLGGFSGDRVVVASGLQGGEQVVVTGQARLRPPGGAVVVREERAAAPPSAQRESGGTGGGAPRGGDSPERAGGSREQGR